MGKPIPYDIRVQMVRLDEAGHSKQFIAEATGCSFEGVKKILRTYRQRGEVALRADYSRCGTTARQYFEESVKMEILLRKDYPPGADYVHSVLREAHPTQRIPAVRTIQRMWAGSNPRQKGSGRQPSNTWTKEVHHTWQIDGKELIRLSDGTTQCSWINVADEASSTALHTEVFPPKDYE